MIISFTLSMPSRNSWNGKWTGDERNYVIVKNLGRTKKAEAKGAKLIEDGPYFYNFGDGWSASISVAEIDPKKSATLRRKSNGFCGYNWMVDEIMRFGEIIGPRRAA